MNLDPLYKVKENLKTALSAKRKSQAVISTMLNKGLETQTANPDLKELKELLDSHNAHLKVLEEEINTLERELTFLELSHKTELS